MNQVCKFVKKGTYLERQGQIVWSNLFEIRGREIVVTTVVDKLDRHLTWLSVKSHNLNHMGKESSLYCTFNWSFFYTTGGSLYEMKYEQNPVTGQE